MRYSIIILFFGILSAQWTGGSANLIESGRKEIGLLAQDVELVYPELVSSDAKGMLSVNYQALSAILINGVKDQEARIAKQEERIVKLEILVNLLLNGK